MPIRTRIQFTVKAKDVAHQNNVGILAILFKEVLQETPPEMTAQMVDNYRAGQVIRVAVAESKYGIEKKCAFQWSVHKDARLQTPQGTA